MTHNEKKTVVSVFNVGSEILFEIIDEEGCGRSFIRDGNVVKYFKIVKGFPLLRRRMCIHEFFAMGREYRELMS